MEIEVFSLPAVKKLLEDFVVASVVTDIGDAAANAVWAKYKPTPSAGIPHYVVLDHDGEVLRRSGATLPGKTKGHEFVAFLKGTRGQVEPKAPSDPEPKTPTGETSVPPRDTPAANGESKAHNLAPMPAELRDVFEFEAAFAAGEVRPGSVVSLELRFKLKTGPGGKYRLYHPDSPHSFIGNQHFNLLILNVGDMGGLAPTGDWHFPQPTVYEADHPENVFDAAEWKYYGDFVVTRSFRVPADAAAGSVFTLTGSLAGQYCDDGVCIWFLDESKTPFAWSATLKASATGPEGLETKPRLGNKESVGPVHKAVDVVFGQTPPKPPAIVPGSGGSLTEEIEASGGLFWFLLGVFGLGMVTLLTPCVLPVLPLTIGFFVKQAEQGRSPLAAAFIYCTCIVGVFTAFGLATSLLLGDQGAQIVSTNAWVNLAIGILFVVFALSFFGMFELRMPSFLSGWISKKQMATQKEGRGYATALLSGGSFAIISFSCTGPIAATILAASAGSAGDESIGRWVPTLAMMVFASGLALPIFVMGMFPSLLKKLPKSGGWMNALKVVFAFIEIAIAIRYFAWAEIAFTNNPVPKWINRDLVDAVWIACSAGAGLYLLGLFRMPHDHEKTEQIGVVRLLIAMGFLAFAVYLVPGLTSEKPMGMLDGFMPPREARPNTGGGSGHAAEYWHQDLDDALAEARKTGKPVFIDFTGVICANCRWVEKNIFPTPEVHPMLLNDFVLCQQWTDKDDDPKAKQTYAKYGEGRKGVPMYVIVDADGNMLEKFVPPQFINSVTGETFAEFMKRGLAKSGK